MENRRRRPLFYPFLALGFLLAIAGVILRLFVWPSEPSFPTHVAHAGGGIHSMDYTNSLEALNANYELGFRFFEIDFSRTADGQLVLLHEWSDYLAEVAGPLSEVPTEEEFLARKLKSGLTPLSLENLVDWLRKHSDAYVITDFKVDAVQGLQKIQELFPRYINRFYPQIYSYSEYEPVKAMGYSHLILTLYRLSTTPDEIVDFAKDHPLYAVCMLGPIALNLNLPQRLHEVGTRVFAHTVNERDFERDLRANSVDGIYTDFLAPPPVE